MFKNIYFWCTHFLKLCLKMNTCSGCENHGLCLDQELFDNLLKPIEYRSVSILKNEKKTKSSEPIDFEKMISKLQECRDDNADYQTKQIYLSQKLVKNCRADSPSSVRNFCTLSTSKAYGEWSEETAQEEFAYCDTEKISNM